MEKIFTDMVSFEFYEFLKSQIYRTLNSQQSLISNFCPKTIYKSTCLKTKVIIFQLRMLVGSAQGTGLWCRIHVSQTNLVHNLVIVQTWTIPQTLLNQEASF